MESSLQAKSSSYPCTNGLEILDDGSWTNIGGNGGVALNASATSLTGLGTEQMINSGQLYRLSKTPFSLTNDSSTFSVYGTGSSNVMVRVVGKTSSNEIVLLGAKKVTGSGNIQIRVCNKSALTSYSSIRFEIYGISSNDTGWS